VIEGHRTRTHRFRELACRESDGIAVRLYWDSLENEVYVTVSDIRGGEDFVLNPPKQDALSAFYHPYASAGRVGERVAVGAR
jgi:hypothetical protein